MICIILKVNQGLDKWDLCFVIYMFLSNNPSSGDMNSSNVSCCISVSDQSRYTGSEFLCS